MDQLSLLPSSIRDILVALNSPVFLEFLEATDNQELTNWMKNLKVHEEIPEAIHSKCIELLNIYMI